MTSSAAWGQPEVDADDINWFPVEAGHVLAFWRALGDTRADDALRAGTSPQELPVPLTFLLAAEQFNLDSTLRPRGSSPWIGSVDSAKESADTGGQFAAEHHMEVLGTYGIGDTLRVTTQPGATWEKQGRRGGRLFFTEILKEFHTVDGRLVARSRSVGLRTERVVDPPSNGSSSVTP